jgi:hypothetical protein
MAEARSALRALRRLARTALVGAALAACGGEDVGPRLPSGQDAAAAVPLASGRIEVRAGGERPRLTLVTRDGDPYPALAVVAANDAGAVASAALAGLVEARLTAAGFSVEARVDRNAFRLAWAAAPERMASFLAALSSAFARPVAAGAPELAAVGKRLASLRQAALDAPEAVPIAACTGRLGVLASEPVPDAASARGAAEVEAMRRAWLHTGAVSLAGVGPASFTRGVDLTWAASAGWARGAAPVDAAPVADSSGVHVSASLQRRTARISAAVRVGDGRAAVAAAERLGAADSPLAARLGTLGASWKLREVVGTARPRGGCVAVTIEGGQLPASPGLEQDAARAAAMIRHEMRVELAAGAEPTVAARQILGAAEPGEAAARAAWWSLAGSAPAAERWATTLAVGPSAELGPRGSPEENAVTAAMTPRFVAELSRALAGGGAATEKRIVLEQGQGAVWMLLASPCGVGDEGADDAGMTALAAAAAVRSRRGKERDVQLEPWVSADGIGVLAYAAPRDGRETPDALARRVGDALGRAVSAPGIDVEALATARAATLTHLESSLGRQGIAGDALAAALSPAHPSAFDPFGSWARVAGGGMEALRLRWQALAAGPLRLAVLANAGQAQGAAAGAAVDRWLSPRRPGATCPADDSPAPRGGRQEVRLPPDTPLAQALFAAPLPPGASSELAELTAAALDGERGLLASALPASLGATATARLRGGGRRRALVIDVRAPAESLAATQTELRALLGRLPQVSSDADIARASAALGARTTRARSHPRQRLVDAWRGAPRRATVRPTLAAWRAFLAETLRDDALVVIEAKPES